MCINRQIQHTHTSILGHANDVCCCDRRRIPSTPSICCLRCLTNGCMHATHTPQRLAAVGYCVLVSDALLRIFWGRIDACNLSMCLLGQTDDVDKLCTSICIHRSYKLCRTRTARHTYRYAAMAANVHCMINSLSTYCIIFVRLVGFSFLIRICTAVALSVQPYFLIYIMNKIPS